ncbi:hypothetical protein BDP27DRAFT_1159965, partial [Rhodocollybia butyracea]
IQRMHPYKATLPGSCPNVLFCKTSKWIVPHIGPLYRATFTLEYYPNKWPNTQTFVQRKPGKSDYSQPGSWRPLVFSEGLAGLLNSVVCDEAMKESEIHSLLPAMQFGG